MLVELERKCVRHVPTLLAHDFVQEQCTRVSQIQVELDQEGTCTAHGKIQGGDETFVENIKDRKSVV